MNNITIRKTEPSDAEGLSTLYSEPSVYSGTLFIPHQSQSAWEKRLHNIPENVYSYVAIADDTIVGNLGFTVERNVRRNHVGGVGIGVKESAQGRGVGSALMDVLIDLSDNWLNLKRIELAAYIDNEKAINLYKKFGFVIEGTAYSFAFRDGEYVDAYYMARVK